MANTESNEAMRAPLFPTMSDTTADVLVEDRLSALLEAGQQNSCFSAAQIMDQIAKSKRDLDQLNQKFANEKESIIRTLNEKCIELETKLDDQIKKNSDLSTKLTDETSKVSQLKNEKGKLTTKLTETSVALDKWKKSHHEWPLIEKVCALFNNVSPTTYESLTKEFLSYRVCHTVAIDEIVLSIVDLAVKNMNLSHIYAKICADQVLEELNESEVNESHFRDAVLTRVQVLFTNVKSQEPSIDAETEERISGDLQRQSDEKQKDNMGIVTFIGYLFLHGVLSHRIVHFCVVELLKSVTKNDQDHFPSEGPDEDSVNCGVQLFKVVGKRVYEIIRAAAAEGRQHNFPYELTFVALEDAMPIVGDGLRRAIMDLVEFRRNGWERNTVDDV